MSGGKTTQGVTANTPSDGGDALAAAGKLKSVQPKCSSDCVPVLSPDLARPAVNI